LYNSASGSFAGYLNTPSGVGAFASGRTANVDDNNKQVYRSTSWWERKVFIDRSATTPTAIPVGEYKVVVAAQHKLSKGDYPADFEVHDVAVITL
jgi:hypothetical protein